MRLRRAVAAAVAATAAAAAASVVYTASRPRPLRSDEAAPIPPELPEGRLVRVPDRGELFIREVAGPGLPGSPTFLLLHGWMMPSDLNWATCFEPLGEVGRVIAVDHRGHGHGPRPAEPFRLADAADDAAALVRHLGTGPVIAIGYSMGGPVAQLLWQRHPDAVQALVLCATSGAFTMTARDRWQWRAMGVLQLLLRLLPRDVWERALRAQAQGGLAIPISRMIHEGTPDEVVELLPWIVGELSRGSAEDLAEAGRELGRYDARGWLPSIDVPTSVIITTEDRLVPASRQYDLASRIPGSHCFEVALDHDGPVAGAAMFIAVLRKAVEAVLESPGR